MPNLGFWGNLGFGGDLVPSAIANALQAELASRAGKALGGRGSKRIGGKPQCNGLLRGFPTDNPSSGTSGGL